MSYWTSIRQYITKYHADDQLASDKRRRFPLIAAFALLLVPASAYGWNAAQSSASSTGASSGDDKANIHKLLRVDSSASPSSDQTNQQHTSVSISSNSTSSTNTSHSVNVDSRAATPGSGSDDAQATVTINGETVSLPSNGSLHKNLSDRNGSTSVDVSVNGQGTDARNTNASSINLQITNDSVSTSGEDETP